MRFLAGRSDDARVLSDETFSREVRPGPLDLVFSAVFRRLATATTLAWLTTEDLVLLFPLKFSRTLCQVAVPKRCRIVAQVPWACEHISMAVVKQFLIHPVHKHTWDYTFMYICSTVDTELK